MNSKGWPQGPGETPQLVREFDWAQTSLGAIRSWPQSRRTAVDIVLHSPIAMVLMCGPDHVMIYNDAYSLIAGPRHPQALGGTVPDIWPEIWDNWNRGIIEAGFRGEVVSHTDQRMQVRRSGVEEEVWFDLYYTPVRDEQQQVWAVLCTVIEITQRVLSERRQRQNEDELRELADSLAVEREAVRAANRQLAAETESLRELFQNAPSFMAVLRGPDHVFALVNEPYRRLVGGRDVIGQPLLQALPEIRDQGYADLLDQVYATGEAFIGRKMPVLLQTESGAHERLLDFVYQPIRNRSGEIVSIFVEGTDVTDRSAAEERLQIAQRAGGIGTFEWYPQTGKLTVSDEFRQLWGLPADIDVTDTLLVDLVHSEDRDKTGPYRLAEGNPLDYTEYRVSRADTGESRWIARRGEVLRSAQGASERYVGACFDITDRKRIEDELRVLADTLEQRVASEIAERSRAEDALRQAKKMEAVGQLTGGIAHDFNNLLQGIVGSLDLVQTYIARGRATEADRFVHSAMSSANRAAALTHRLLAFARRQPLDPKPIGVNQLIASMDDLLRRSLGVAIELEMVLAGGLWMTRCDANQLENAILNLAINARDAMPQGGRLTIETCNTHLDQAHLARQRDVAPGQYVCICVSDTGIGMAPDVAERAFDPFFTTKPIGQGTGLGLSMIYGFTRQSDGYARIYSDAGQGTTVKLYLPRFLGEAGAAAAEPVADAQVSAAPGRTILVVEDERVVRNLVVEVLSDLGYRVLEAADGPSALKLIDGEIRIDLLLTDIGLPGMNGHLVADAARGKRPGLKVLFMTGYAENAAVSSGFLAPGMQLMTKPFAMSTLATRVSEIMKSPGDG
ncbi:PAS domain S-box protein [Hydrocarboniphaga sp.]|uniref:PAS domain-containing hybrid sensor histidine kinase/response regulator n=1 Tax=Hydrocarboniphaga sp. TaxID=2033016 RepID=UPI003D11DF90